MSLCTAFTGLLFTTLHYRQFFKSLHHYEESSKFELDRAGGQQFKRLTRLELDFFQAPHVTVLLSLTLVTVTPESSGQK